ncbi:hypothetical protein PHYPO_G00141050 [Pangasianodon hypophthalmus]|uniref:Uncharacterized protein n=1 Tax=Pangasianodon hypophthalmus TaxID=310915 RepID=A0A5N5KDW1_PANHP|nr:hypothetical protein PHYPO_G00141050 [Pangasianodon hypophthalmus]
MLAALTDASSSSFGTDSASKGLAAIGLAARLTENFRCYESGKDERIWTTTDRRYGLSLGFGVKVALASRLTLLASLATANHQVNVAP